MHSLATSQSRCELALRFGPRVRVRVTHAARTLMFAEEKNRLDRCFSKLK